MDFKYAQIEIHNVANAQEDEWIYGGDVESPRPWWKSRGWKSTVRLGFVGVIAVFIINLAVLIWSVAGIYKSSEGVTTVYTGSCGTVGNVSTFGHLAINVLSSLLLAASNNCMQILLSPTRSIIDKAHAKHKWLDVGVHTVRNFYTVGMSRRWLWILLMLTSIPLHLLYNSVLIESKVENDYAVVLASSNFLSGGYWNSSRSGGCFSTDYTDANPAIQFLQDHQDKLEKLDNQDCITAYSQQPISKYGNVLLVTGTTSNETILNVWSVTSMSNLADHWLCGLYQGTAPCDTSTLDASNWNMTGTTLESIPTSGEPYVNDIGEGLQGECGAPNDQIFKVDYCLAQTAMENCTVGLAPALLGVVLVCNAIKAICLFITFSRLKFQPIVTIGDAVASFLEAPDAVTTGFGPIEATDDKWQTRRWNSSARPWGGSSRHGFSAASSQRWIWGTILFVGFWGLCLGLLFLGLEQFKENDLGTDLSSIAANGLGRVNPNDLLDHEVFNTLFASIIVPNLPQVIISILYVHYNDLLTRMLLAREWASYALSHRPLRVSRPRGQQVESYFLSLPWKIAVPFLVLMMLLHWFVSQSIFLAYVTGSDYGSCDANGVPKDIGVVTLGIGWSPLALVLSLGLGGALILLLWLVGGALRYKPGIPLVRSSSAAISAACHPKRGDDDAAGRKVMYGVLDGEVGENGLRRVGLSSGHVEPLVKGQVYC